VRRLVVAPPARRAFKDILAHSRERFGPEIEDRYRRLFIRALADLRQDPGRRGVRHIGDDLCLYHLRFSRLAIAPPDRIGRPRHLIAFRFDSGQVTILYLLHERMNFPDRLR
jgi:plasmid stabilization system protein ParE